MTRMMIAIVAVLALATGGLLASGLVPTTGAQSIAQGPSAEPSAEVTKAGYRTVTLRVEKMWCAACPTIVRRSLEAVDGVAEATVSYRDKTAVVSYDPAKCGSKDLISATARIGYPSSVIQ